MPSHRRPIPRRKPSRRLPSRLPLWLGAAAAAFVVLFSGFYLTATSLENHDSFCASCHTQPETDYYQRSLGSQTADLASWHAQQKATRCIECHSGPGVPGRVQALGVGGIDLLMWVVGQARQPAPLTVPIGDANCTKCHPSVTSESDFQHHFHQFLPRWQAADPNAATCVACHGAHATDGDPNAMFIQTQRTDQICQQCHAAAGVG